MNYECLENAGSVSDPHVVSVSSHVLLCFPSRRCGLSCFQAAFTLAVTFAANLNHGTLTAVAPCLPV